MPVSLVSSIRPRLLDGFTVASGVPPTIYRPAILAPYEPNIYAPVVPTPRPNPVALDPPLPEPGAMPLPDTLIGVGALPDLKGFVDPIRGVIPRGTNAAGAMPAPDQLQKMGPLGVPVWAWLGIVVLLILLLS